MWVQIGSYEKLIKYQCWYYIVCYELLFFCLLQFLEFLIKKKELRICLANNYLAHHRYDNTMSVYFSKKPYRERSTTLSSIGLSRRWYNFNHFWTSSTFAITQVSKMIVRNLWVISERNQKCHLT